MVVAVTLGTKAEEVSVAVVSTAEMVEECAVVEPEVAEVAVLAGRETRLRRAQVAGSSP